MIRKQQKKSIKLRAGPSKKANKIVKPLAKLIKKKRDRAQINKIRNGKGEVTTNTTEIRRTIKDCPEQLHANKMEKLEEMDKF